MNYGAALHTSSTNLNNWFIKTALFWPNILQFKEMENKIVTKTYIEIMGLKLTYIIVTHYKPDYYHNERLESRMNNVSIKNLLTRNLVLKWVPPLFPISIWDRGKVDN